MFKVLAATGVFAALALTSAPAFALNSPPSLVAGCASRLDAMSAHTVRKETVRAIGAGYRIAVVPFCIGIGPLSFGNASGLGKTIGANPLLAGALRQAGWRADDVTNITISGRSVMLYVHTE